MSFEKALSEYQEEVGHLVRLLDEITEDEINYIPVRKDGWSIKRHILHLVNSETQSMLRIMMMENKPSNIINVIDSSDWIDNIDINLVSTRACVDYLEKISDMIVVLIRAFGNNSYKNKKIKCLYQNENVEVFMYEDIESGIDHFKFHQEFIRENLFEYKEKMS